MKSKHNKKKDFLSICKTILIFTLILGILSSSFGVSVLAIKNKKNGEVPDGQANTPQGTTPEGEKQKFEAPTESYTNLSNEIDFNDEVVVISEEESDILTEGIIDIENYDSYYGDYTRISLGEADYSFLDDVDSGELLFIQGDSDSALGGDRIYEVVSNRWDGYSPYIEVREPSFEEAFESMEIAASDYLTEDNLVESYYVEGVSAYFGDIEKDMAEVESSGDVSEITNTNYQKNTSPTVTTLASTKEVTAQNLDIKNQNPPAVTQTATDNVSKNGDLIIEIDCDFSKLLKKEDDDNPIEKSFGIKGEFGIKDIATHLVVDMPSITEMKEFYIGLSGDCFANIHPYGKIEAKAEPESGKKEFKLLNLEGLKEKLLPIAVFKFNGTSPIYITNSAFENGKKSVIPSLYLVLYANWEGEISLELSGDFEFSHSFNNGLRVAKDGKLALGFESYPYVNANDATKKDGFTWNVNLSLEADTDLTLFGGSLLVYIAGINIAEVGIARIGMEAVCNVKGLEFGSDVETPLIDEDAELYLRGYLKLIEVRVKLKAEGKSFLSFLSADANFDFTLLDITLFELGKKKDKFISKTPVSSMSAPTEFASVISLVMDVSGSMDSSISTGESKLEAAKTASEIIVDSLDQWSSMYEGNYGLGLVQFADASKTIALPHIDYPYLKQCIGTMADGGGTHIQAGIESALSQLDAVQSKNKVIILLTDGDQNGGSDAVKAAEEAAKKGIKIYTVGFGYGANESLLQNVAEITGAEYQFADTNNIMGIIGSFIFAQQSTEANVLAEKSDTVGEGETSEEITFNIDDQSGNLLVTTAWPGSFLDTILIDPNDKIVDENYPGSVTDESKIPSTITVKNPLKGKWKVKVKGVETSYEQEPFYTIVSFKEADTPYINEEMKTMEKVAAYCLAIGIFMTISSILLLPCVARKKQEK